MTLIRTEVEKFRSVAEEEAEENEASTRRIACSCEETRGVVAPCTWTITERSAQLRRHIECHHRGVCDYRSEQDRSLRTVGKHHVREGRPAESLLPGHRVLWAVVEARRCDL
jgi:hypothetical protein